MAQLRVIMKPRTGYILAACVVVTLLVTVGALLYFTVDPVQILNPLLIYPPNGDVPPYLQFGVLNTVPSHIVAIDIRYYNRPLYSLPVMGGDIPQGTVVYIKTPAKVVDAMGGFGVYPDVHHSYPLTFTFTFQDGTRFTKSITLEAIVQDPGFTVDFVISRQPLGNGSYNMTISVTNNGDGGVTALSIDLNSSRQDVDWAPFPELNPSMNLTYLGHGESMNGTFVMSGISAGTTYEFALHVAYSIQNVTITCTKYWPVPVSLP